MTDQLVYYPQYIRQNYIYTALNMSDHITTYSGIKFSPLSPKEEDICIDDIAHALSLMTRANGHFPEFYSVAQHCIACCKEATARGYSNRVALALLLHDASEAYLSDITRHVKQYLEVYLQAEERLQNMVYSMFLDELPNKEEQKQIDSVDNAMLYHEFLHYTSEELIDYKSEILFKPDFRFIEFKLIEQKYKDLFYSLISPTKEY